MITPQLWLANFLQRRDMQKPDGRMLYAYRLDEVEYANLRNLLSVWLRDDVLGGGGHLAFGVAESFVLYGAAWWQRQYAGGAWRWEDVIQSFGGAADNWTAQFRTQCVQVGLQFWKQKVGTAGKKYFGVLVEQGGLPRVLLAKSQGNIASLIRAVLKRAARLGAEVDEIAVMVRDYDDKLPQSLQNETVHLLIAQVVGTVLGLKREFKLTRGENAVAKLESLDKHWRERFPIALDDQAAIALLSDLVGEVAALEAETRASPILAERFLREDSGAYSLISQVDFPKSIDGGALARLAKVEPDELPFRFSIEIHTDKKQLVADVRKVLGSTPARYQFTVLQAGWSGAAALREHVLCIALSGGSHVSASVPGGMELDPAVPWSFVPIGEECRFVAQGSARVRQEQAYLVVDNAWKVEPSGEHSVIEQLGPFSCGALDKSVIKVRGDITINDGSNLFRIRTQQVGVENDRLVWEGPRFGFGSNPSLIFYGLPKLYRYTVEGERILVPPSELEWRVAGTSRVISPPAAARGPVDVLWRTHGEVRLRSRMVILDKQAQLKFQSGESITQGCIHVPACWGVDVISPGDATLQVRVERNPAWISVHVEATEHPPESLTLVLDWKNSPVPCRLLLPFPASGGRFLDRDDNQFPANASITRHQLLGVRLRVFDANPDHPVRHKLVFSLHCDGLERLPASVRPIEHIIALDNNHAEIRLIDCQNDIESLLSLTDALDACVTIELYAGRKRAATLRVKRYEFSLVREGTGVSIAATDLPRLTPAALSEIQVMAVAIENMHKSTGILLPQHVSEGVVTGQWSIPDNVANNHQWLVYPAPESKHSFRAVVVDPLFGQIPMPTGYTPAPESMQDVLLIADSATRRSILARRLKMLAEDYANPDWQFIEGIWTHLGHLSLPSLDLWRALVLSPEALTAFVCRNWASHSLEDVFGMCVRFQDELGVLWETIPISTWHKACQKLSVQWQSMLPPELLSAIVPKQVADTLGGMRLHFPALNTLLAFVTFDQTGLAADAVAPMMRTSSKEYKKRLWDGTDSAIQNILLRNHLDRSPPRLDLYEQLIRAFYDKNERRVQAPDTMLKAVLPLLWDPTNEKAGLANIPVLLALCGCNALLRHWWTDPKRLIELRQYRDFDRMWFCHAFDQAVAMFISAGFFSARTSN
jgi:hypothetical protein